MLRKWILVLKIQSKLITKINTGLRERIKYVIEVFQKLIECSSFIYSKEKEQHLINLIEFGESGGD